MTTTSTATPACTPIALGCALLVAAACNGGGTRSSSKEGVADSGAADVHGDGEEVCGAMPIRDWKARYVFEKAKTWSLCGYGDNAENQAEGAWRQATEQCVDHLVEEHYTPVECQAQGCIDDIRATRAKLLAGEVTCADLDETYWPASCGLLDVAYYHACPLILDM